MPQTIYDWIGLLDYAALAAVALFGAYCCLLVWSRVGQKWFKTEDEQETFLDSIEPDLLAGLEHNLQLDGFLVDTARDLLSLVPIELLPNPFDTAHLAAVLERPRWFAQKVSYCLRQTGVAKVAGKRGNTQLYRLSPQRRTRKTAA